MARLWVSIVLTLFLFAGYICPQYSYAQTGEVDRTILPGIPIIESVNLYERSSYLQNWAITKDRDGILFVGTAGNLMYFDGDRWNRHSTEGPAVRSIEPGFNGDLIIGGVSQLGIFERSGTALVDTLLYRNLVNKVAESQKNFGYVNTIIVQEDSSVFFEGERFSFHLKEDSLTTLSDNIWIFRLFETHNSIITNDSLGISIYEDGNLNLIPGAEQFEYTGINCLMEKEDEGFLFQVRNDGIYTYEGTFQKQESEASNFLRDLLPYTCQKLQDGSYFVGTTTGGGIRFTAKGTVLGKFTTDTGLPENIIYDSYLDVDGTLWLSHMEHISKLNFGSPIRQFHRSDDFEGLPHSIQKFRGDYFVSTDRGLFTIGETNNTIQKIFSTSIDSKLFEANRDLFLYTNRVLYKPLESTEPVLRFRHLINNIYPYQKNSSIKFTFSERGVTIINHEEDDSFSETSFLTIVDMLHGNMVEDEIGNVWMASNSGNFISITANEIERFLKSGEADVKEYPMPEGWHSDRNRLIFPLTIDDEILLGTPTGLYRLDKETDTVVVDNRFGEFSRVYEATGNPTSIHRMTADEEGNIWLRASRGFHYAEKQDDGSYQIYNNSLRLINDNQNNDILAEGDGKAWFVGSEGLFFYDHSLATEPSVRPPIIRTVTAREDSLVFQAYNREKSKNNTLRLPYELNDIRIEYAFTDYSSFEGTEYQVKLDGFDDDWSLWNEEAQKDYTQIREGSYRFMVRAKDVTGIVSEASVLPIQILPPWYRTFWAYLLYFGIISGLLYGIHMFRIQRILHVQGIRNRIASDLHDEISATLSSISYFSEAIERGGDETKSKRYLELISKGANEAKEKITDIIWSINPENDDWENLLTKCRRYAADIFESKGIEYKINFDESETGKVDIVKRKNLWLIFKEIVTNIARHSEATSAQIQFHFRNGEVLLEIADNGVGFDTTKSRESNGIKNIKTRANQVGLSAELVSTNDGSVWKLKGRL